MLRLTTAWHSVCFLLSYMLSHILGSPHVQNGNRSICTWLSLSVTPHLIIEICLKINDWELCKSAHVDPILTARSSGWYWSWIAEATSQNSLASSMESKWNVSFRRWSGSGVIEGGSGGGGGIEDRSQNERIIASVEPTWLGCVALHDIRRIKAMHFPASQRADWLHDSFPWHCWPVRYHLND